MESDITKQLKKKRNIFGAISVLLWVGTAIASVIAMLCKIDMDESSGTPIFSPEFKAFLVSLGVTVIIGIIVACIIKNKIRTFIWMICTVLNAAIFKEAGMYITLSLWFVDEYIMYALYKRYADRVKINREIDLRIN